MFSKFPSGWASRLLLALVLAAGPAWVSQAQVPPVVRRLATSAADTAAAPPLPAATTPAPPLRRPAASRLRELRRQRAFRYTDVVEAPTQAGFWARLVAWLWRLLGPLLATKGGRIAWKTIFYALLGTGLVFAVLKLLQVDLTRAFGRAPRTLPLAYEAGQENIHELNFAEAVAQAEATGNLRLALRLGYLEVLKQLTDRDFIAWQPDKTNQAYLRELAASYPAAQPTFAELTRQFEYSWYGELPLSATDYHQARTAQRGLAQQLASVAPQRASHDQPA